MSRTFKTDIIQSHCVCCRDALRHCAVDSAPWSR